ncbi:kinase-like protein [Hyaloscypha variabilis F]|uniref:non-specific serine/threonine protein kinase n=1 Tax=Hyaloscypha variabilis (strain UAMH 11265 / GT02V1 / F) TaxID=1149755 RepID=A0A2J6QVB1_HYAVF|nr:kinase-like protein [Hyaloscypha variabilis F]
MSTVFPEQEQLRLRRALHELDALPQDWLIGADKRKRITYQKGTEGLPTFTHPTLGDLPRPWIVRICGPGKEPKYFNTETSRTVEKNPRHDRKVLRKCREGSQRHTVIAYHREEVKTEDIRDDYEIIKALDDPNSKTKIGAFNGGAFVVRHKKSLSLSVEKRFKADDIKWAQSEIYMLQRLRHPSIAVFTAGFVTPDLKRASVYVEFCDRGSMDDLIKNFEKQRQAAKSWGSELPEMPERFVWHAFAGLCDGLAYLMGGRSYASPDVTDYEPEPGWVPVLHRDMKTDNILLRSRSTVGTKRYFYCVLSDFGLACDDYPPGHPKENAHQRCFSKLGTYDFLAPELCWDPYPESPLGKDSPQRKWFPNKQKHSAKSDLWALAAVMQNLAICQRGAHLDFESMPKAVAKEPIVWCEGLRSRKPLDITTVSRKRPFTNELRDLIKIAGRFDPAKRLDPIAMMEFMKRQIAKTKYTNHMPKGHDHEALPDWATRVHDYHSLPAIDPSIFKQG